MATHWAALCCSYSNSLTKLRHLQRQLQLASFIDRISGRMLKPFEEPSYLASRGGILSLRLLVTNQLTRCHGVCIVQFPAYWEGWGGPHSTSTQLGVQRSCLDSIRRYSRSYVTSAVDFKMVGQLAHDRMVLCHSLSLTDCHNLSHAICHVSF